MQALTYNWGDWQVTYLGGASHRHVAIGPMGQGVARVQVFEHMEMNLRELTRKVGVGCGIKIDAVAQLSLQMLIALKHLTATRVLHADIKPDNILINSRMNKIKLCDLGSALFAGGANDLTPYLVSRFYRSPEVILGLPYGAISLLSLVDATCKVHSVRSRRALIRMLRVASLCASLLQTGALSEERW